MDKTIILIISFFKKNKARYDRSGHAELEDSWLPTNILTMFSFQVLISTRFFFKKQNINVAPVILEHWTNTLVVRDTCGLAASFRLRLPWNSGKWQIRPGQERSKRMWRMLMSCLHSIFGWLLLLPPSWTYRRFLWVKREMELFFARPLIHRRIRSKGQIRER